MKSIKNELNKIYNHDILVYSGLKSEDAFNVVYSDKQKYCRVCNEPITNNFKDDCNDYCNECFLELMEYFSNFKP